MEEAAEVVARMAVVPVEAAVMATAMGAKATAAAEGYNFCRSVDRE